MNSKVSSPGSGFWVPLLMTLIVIAAGAGAAFW